MRTYTDKQGTERTIYQPTAKLVKSVLPVKVFNNLHRPK